jgi:hypothetical protein
MKKIITFRFDDNLYSFDDNLYSKNYLRIKYFKRSSVISNMFFLGKYLE